MIYYILYLLHTWEYKLKYWKYELVVLSCANLFLFIYFLSILFLTISNCNANTNSIYIYEKIPSVEPIFFFFFLNLCVRHGINSPHLDKFRCIDWLMSFMFYIDAFFCERQIKEENIFYSIFMLLFAITWKRLTTHKTLLKRKIKKK